MHQVTSLGGKYKRRDILERGHRRIARVGKRLEQFGQVIPCSGAPALEQDGVDFARSPPAPVNQRHDAAREVWRLPLPERFVSRGNAGKRQLEANVRFLG